MTENNLPAVTIDVAKANIRLSLTKAEKNIQSVIDKERTLVYNEDNIAVIKEFSNDLKEIKNLISDAHKEGKKPYLEGGDAWDAAKNDLLGQILPILTKVDNKHAVLCQAVEKRKSDKVKADKKKKEVEELISITILNFSGEITACKNSKELTAVESKINLEKTRQQKYGDQLPDLIEKCNELNELLKGQKEVVRELEIIKESKWEAETLGDDATLEQLIEKEDELLSKIGENKVRVEEKALNSTVKAYSHSNYTEVYPDVKVSRRSWDYEIKDMAALYKKYPHLVSLEINKEALKAFMKEKVATEGKDNEEIVVLSDNFRFYVKKKY